MARDKDWIGKHCSQGTSFKTLARAAGGLETGDVYYVDLANGTDSGDGDNWTRAFLTVNYAYDQVTADGNDYIIVRGWKTETGTGVIASLDVAQTHLIGHAGILNPYFPEKGSFYRSGAGDAPHTRIANEFIEVAGIAFNAVQSTGTESSSVSKGALEINDYLDANVTSDANKAYVHGCYFPDWNSSTTTTGITITGAHYPVLQDIVVDSIYGNIDSGIYISGADDSNAAYGVFENLLLRGGPGGNLAAAIKLYAGSSLQMSVINGLYAPRVTNAISLGAASGAYCTLDNAIAGCTEATFFAGDAACDARDDLWTQYKWIVGENVAGRDAKFQDT